MTLFDQRKIQSITTAMSELPMEDRLAICTAVVSGAAPVYHGKIEKTARALQDTADQLRSEHFGTAA